MPRVQGSSRDDPGRPPAPTAGRLGGAAGAAGAGAIVRVGDPVTPATSGEGIIAGSLVLGAAVVGEGRLTGGSARQARPPEPDEQRTSRSAAKPVRRAPSRGSTSS